MARSTSLLWWGKIHVNMLTQNILCRIQDTRMSFIMIRTKLIHIGHVPCGHRSIKKRGLIASFLMVNLSYAPNKHRFPHDVYKETGRTWHNEPHRAYWITPLNLI